MFTQSYSRQILVGQPREGVCRTSLMSSSLLLQQCPACLVHFIWIVLERGGKWAYSCCFVGCCFQDLFNIARSILVHFLSSFFSLHFVSVHVVHPYSSIDIAASPVGLEYIYCIPNRGVRPPPKPWGWQ